MSQEKRRTYWAKNVDRLKAQRAEYRKANRERIKEIRRGLMFSQKKVIELMKHAKVPYQPTGTYEIHMDRITHQLTYNDAGYCVWEILGCAYFYVNRRTGTVKGVNDPRIQSKFQFVCEVARDIEEGLDYYVRIIEERLLASP
jgi:hypothetical protein